MLMIVYLVLATIAYVAIGTFTFGWYIFKDLSSRIRYIKYDQLTVSGARKL
jgi:hypothetical protein